MKINPHFLIDNPRLFYDNHIVLFASSYEAKDRVMAEVIYSAKGENRRRKTAFFEEI